MTTAPNYQIRQLDDLLLLTVYLTGKNQAKYVSDRVHSLDPHAQQTLLSDPIYYAVENGITTFEDGEQVIGINTTGARIHSLGVNASQTAIRRAPLPVLQLIANTLLGYLNEAGQKRALQTLTMRRSRAKGGKGHALACSKDSAHRFSELLKKAKEQEPKMTGDKLLRKMMDVWEEAADTPDLHEITK